MGYIEHNPGIFMEWKKNPVVSSNMASWKLSELHYWLLDKYPYIAGYNTHEQTSVQK